MVSEFAAEMNQRADELDMGYPERTRFNNPAGRDRDPWNAITHYSTAADMAKLARAAWENTLFREVDAIPPGMGGCPTGVPSKMWCLQFEWQPFPNGPWVSLPAWTPAQFPAPAPALARGVKYGSTPLARSCGIFAAEDPLGNVIAASFGAESSSLRKLDRDALLVLGTTGFCGTVGANPGGPLAVEPDLLFMGNVSTAEDSMAVGGVEEGEEGADSLQVSVRREGTSPPPAVTLSLTVTGYADVILPPNESVDFGIAPFESHRGFTITNSGQSVASLLITRSHPPQQQSVQLNPDAQWIIPAYGGPRVGRFSLRIVNLSHIAHAAVEVQELGYNFAVSAGAGDMFSAYVQTPGDGVVSIMTEGTDPAPGGRVTVALRTPLGAVSVENPPTEATLEAPSLELNAKPNPFFGRTVLEYEMRQTGSVDVSIYDVAGRQVRQFAPERRQAGTWSLEWLGNDDHGRPLPSGVYFYQLQLDGKRAAEGRLVLLR